MTHLTADWILHAEFLLQRMEFPDPSAGPSDLLWRSAGAMLTAFLLMIVSGPFAIRWLSGHFRERICSDSNHLNQLHSGKQNTPTMGGIWMMGVVLVAVLLWSDSTNRYVQIGIGLTLSLGLLGAWDDWIKLRTLRKGLTIRQKFSGQLVIAVLTGAALSVVDSGRPDAFSGHLLGVQDSIPLGPLFVFWAAFVIVGSSNAVNLTDGLDGLAAGCSAVAVATTAGLTYLSQSGETLSSPISGSVSGVAEFVVFGGGLVGGLLGFLWFNAHPAQVFMGDAGSLPVGGLLALTALVSRQELLLLVTGGVLVAETVSVVLQVAWFRLTGRRLIRCSPLHNHFLFRGDPEIRIVIRFWMVSVILAVLSISLFALR